MKLNLSKIKSKITLATLTTPALISLMKIKTYAAATIGTQEVETATDNIKNAVIKVAPVRKCAYVCIICFSKD